MKRIQNIFASKINYITRPGRLIQISILLIFTLMATNAVQAQEDEPFNRDGRWLVETGYNIVSGLTGGGTGVNYLVDTDGESLTSIGAEIGKFTSQNFAIKVKFGLLSSGGFDITSFGIGGKLYMGGNVPLDFGVGLLDGPGDTQIQANLGIGYAMNLAPNITLEPSFGGLIVDEELLINFKIGFAMFL